MTENSAPINVEPVSFKPSELNKVYLEFPHNENEREGAVIFERLGNDNFYLELISLFGITYSLGEIHVSLPSSHWFLNDKKGHFVVDLREFDNELEHCFGDPFLADSEAVRFEIGEPNVDGVSAVTYKGTVLKRECFTV